MSVEGVFSGMLADYNGDHEYSHTAVDPDPSRSQFNIDDVPEFVRLCTWTRDYAGIER